MVTKRGTIGSHTLYGGPGGDQLFGLAGNDVYYVSGRTDFMFEDAGGGTDTVYVRGDFVLNAGSSVEVIEAADRTSTTSRFLGGNELTQTIYGGAGNDLINGGGQDRTVNGGDYLYGGAGDDTYRVFGDSQFKGSLSENIVEYSGEGSDSVYISGSYRLPGFTSVELRSFERRAAV